MAAMDDVPRHLLQAAYQRKPIYLLKVPLFYGLWAAGTYGLVRLEGHPAFVPAGLAFSVFVAMIIRGLGSVAHDAVHGSCSRSKRVSYWFSLLCWAPTGMSVTLYANYHLHHHRIANTYPDVDNFVVTDYTRHPVLAKALLLLVYTFFYPIYWLAQMGRYMKRLTFWQRVRMNVEVIGWFGFIAFMATVLSPMVFLFFYGIPFVLSAFLASVTSMIEHYEMLPGEDAYGSRTYATKSHVTNFLWNNVTFHTEHHKFPGIPFYNLRSFHEAAYPYYDDKVKAAVFEAFWPIVFQLWGRILKFDVAALDARYVGLNKQAERDAQMSLDGIQPGAV